jgi:hypothetical protein
MAWYHLVEVALLGTAVLVAGFVCITSTGIFATALRAHEPITTTVAVGGLAGTTGGLLVTATTGFVRSIDRLAHRAPLRQSRVLGWLRSFSRARRGP